MPRIHVAVIGRDGAATIVNVGRPGVLVEFVDAHPGKEFPAAPQELAWCVHYALGDKRPLAEWLATVEDISPMPADLALARRLIAGETTLADAVDEEITERIAAPAATPNGPPTIVTEPVPEGEPEPVPEGEPEPDPTTATPGGSSLPV